MYIYLHQNIFDSAKFELLNMKELYNDNPLFRYTYFTQMVGQMFPSAEWCMKIVELYDDFLETDHKDLQYHRFLFLLITQF